MKTVRDWLRGWIAERMGEQYVDRLIRAAEQSPIHGPRLDLKLTPERRDALIADLEDRFGTDLDEQPTLIEIVQAELKRYVGEERARQHAPAVARDAEGNLERKFNVELGPHDHVPALLEEELRKGLRADFDRYL